MDKHLHIVSLDVPWPADYGGAIEIFYTIKALHQAGIKIHLHCFTKGKLPQDELKKYCVEVYYYQRKKGLAGLSLVLSYIVNSRSSKDLLINLKKDNYPILFEGIHCTYWLKKGALSKRATVIRLHNVEYKYYKQLSKQQSSWFEKCYFLYESWMLKKYEHAIAKTTALIAMNSDDANIYKQEFGATNVSYIPPFIAWSMSVGKEGKGCFCLYHGNLSISENEAAAAWLLNNVFNTLQIPFVIAGKNPSKELLDLAHQYNHTCIVANPGDKEMQDLIGKAQVHVLPSFNNTGVKLKLLNALFSGRHCVINRQGVQGSGLETTCHIAEDAISFKKVISEIYELPFTEQEKEKRQGLLQTTYNNEVNAKKLIEILWPENVNRQW